MAILKPEQRRQLLEGSRPAVLMGEIMSLAAQQPRVRGGLAQFLAEQGLLPMYGMPTRVRNLYLGAKREAGVVPEEYDWSVMDRDLEMAIYEFAPGAVLVKDKARHRVIGFTGPLPDPERRGRDVVVDPPKSDWFGEATHVAWCLACGAASHRTDRPGAPVQCVDCSEDVPEDAFNYYVSPSAFRTDFRPTPKDVESAGQMAIRTVATIQHDGFPTRVGSLTVHAGAGTTIMNLNSGVEDENGQAKFFGAEVITDNDVMGWQRNVTLPEQAVDPDIEKLAGSPAMDGDGSGRRAVRAARAEGDGRAFPRSDRLQQPAESGSGRASRQKIPHRCAVGRDQRHAPARAEGGACSRRGAGRIRSVRAEAERRQPDASDSRHSDQRVRPVPPPWREWPRRRSGDREAGARGRLGHWTLKDFLDGRHVTQCSTSCYACVQQYQNRRYHPLLDWRLALSYLRGMIDPRYACGLDGDFDTHPELRGWLAKAHGLAQAVASMRPRTLTYGRAGTGGRLPCLEERSVDGRLERRYVVVHPLWRLDAASVQEFGVASDGNPLSFVDTFDLERRPLNAVKFAATRPEDDALARRGGGPAAAA
jgi:hypothetical protein